MNEKAEIQPNAVYTLQEAADVLNLHYNTVWRRVKEGQIKSKREGTKPLIKGAWLEEYLRTDRIFSKDFETFPEAVDFVKESAGKFLDGEYEGNRRVVISEWDKPTVVIYEIKPKQ